MQTGVEGYFLLREYHLLPKLPEFGSKILLDLFITGHEQEHVAFGSATTLIKILGFSN